MIATSIFPTRYVQGAGALSLLSEEARRLGDTALAVVDPAVLLPVAQAARRGAIVIALETFNGECSDEEIERLASRARDLDANVIIGAGGGKALDTAKAVAHLLSLPVAVVPTLASTDAPCSALSVVYSAEGAFKRYLVLPRNPDLVLVDTQVIAAAPVRFLVSGMGDALSTLFEAEDCAASGAANMTGRPGTMTALGLARLCFDTLLADGVAAKRACEAKTVSPALERVVEANTLLSGLGFESGGLSGAHAIHNGLTALPATHPYWHGEKVAMGTLALLMLTGRPRSTITTVYGFCESVGLPTTLADIGLADVTDGELARVAEMACEPNETIHNIAGGVTPEQVVAALKAADGEGRRRHHRQAAE
ncbi:MAG: glycerol dehydrogenase [Magnetospirillum sp.]|nr:glycerol dehydrogenase [Magnetospirillum sp.]